MENEYESRTAINFWGTLPAFVNEQTCFDTVCIYDREKATLQEITIEESSSRRLFDPVADNLTKCGTTVHPPPLVLPSA